MPRDGSVMGRGQIHAILANPVYAGRFRHKTQTHNGQHTAIIDPERWNAVQVALRRAMPARPGSGIATTSHGGC